MVSKIEVPDSQLVGQIPFIQVLMGIAIVIVGLLAIAYVYVG